MNKKIGFDIHGVIDNNPTLFAEITKKFQTLGYEVHILTGSLITPEILRELDMYNIKYDCVFSILGHHKKLNTDTWEDENGWWIDDDEWEKTKSIYCREHNLDLHIDDSKSYGKYFTTPYAYLSPIKDNPRIMEISGDVESEILDILKEHEGYYKMRF